jgi:hypothetical protein
MTPIDTRPSAVEANFHDYDDSRRTAMADRRSHPERPERPERRWLQ